ncbi:FkbM family methyltransferase [Prosthecobacter sp.]|uniref:FkbM family methyltransferase n=1 Tax=Prosthecobacter sp. TaxID=1965333 RepID=UPI002ABA068A|nr:FkbM family methyltransferase [Prosthecobacter sp.]MDZ4401086.1 FkbM family methyltransferase [Prosthecobacter sp.]
MIRHDGVVFDFGVNNGGFARLVAPKCARVVGFEADPTWLGRVSLPANVRVLPQALAAKAGTLRFHVNQATCSSLHYSDVGAETVEVPAVTLADALALEPAARIDLIKMDIEGEEVAVLRDAPSELFARVGQMTVEFHDFLDPSSLPAILEVIERMKSLGFLVFKMSWHSYGDMLFVNRRLQPMSLLQQFKVGVIHKYGSGIGRILRRWFLSKAKR